MTTDQTERLLRALERIADAVDPKTPREKEDEAFERGKRALRPHKEWLSYVSGELARLAR